MFSVLSKEYSSTSLAVLGKDKFVIIFSLCQAFLC